MHESIPHIPNPAYAEFQQQQNDLALKAHLHQVHNLIGQFQHVNELSPITRELMRDLRGTLNGTFMMGVS